MISLKNEASLMMKLSALLADINYANYARAHYSESYIGDYVTFNENQTSQMLSWYLDPKEGHHQGDYFVRCLLSHYFEHASDIPLTDQQHLAIGLSYENIKIITEHTLPNKKRIDIIAVEPQQKVLIIIERKDGTKAHSNQLSAYREWAEANFPDWAKFYILSDSHELDHKDQNDPHYVTLNDAWLVNAISHLKGQPNLAESLKVTFNSSLRLLDCNFEYEIDKTWLKLAKKLSHTHSQLLDQLAITTIQCGNKTYPLLSIDPSTYLTLLASDNSILDSKLLQVLQSHYYYIESLTTINEFEGFEDHVKLLAPQEISLNFEHYKNCVTFTHQPHAITDDSFWPYYLKLTRCEKLSEQEHETFQLSLVLYRKAHEKAQPYFEKIAKAYNIDVPASRINVEIPLLEELSSVNLTPSNMLTKTLKNFFKKVIEID